jgi:GT2 family glycosyltransferase
MRRRVHAVVIARRRGDRLIQTLEALRGQQLAPEGTVVVDLTGDASAEEMFREQLGRDHSVTILSGRQAMGWSEALNLARSTLPDEGWMWVLRDDTTPHKEALAHLHSAVDGAPSVVMAGPKQRMSEHGGWLREFGETITTWGERQAIVDRELDQGQYDRMSDVMAVGDAGLLIQLGVFDALGGADPALDPLDAPLDLGIRARLAGHRVLAVPAAVVYVERGPADWRAGKDLGAATMFRLDRAAWLYRRFAYSAWWALIPLVLLSLPGALLRSGWQFAAKRPDLAVSEVVATLAALWRLPQAIVAKARLSQSKTVAWAALAPLRMSPGDHRRRRQLRAEARFASAEESARSRTRPAFWPAGAWLIVGLAALGTLISGPLVGARALVGGGMLPLATSIESLWAQVRWLQPYTVGNVWGEQLIPADPAALVLALIGSITWWQPSLALVGLWFAAPLLSGLIAWWAGSQFLQRQLATTVFALLWVLQPSFLLALTEGRWQAVLLHMALPWLLATMLSAHTSWQRAAAGGFATALVTALAPVLWPAVVFGWLVVVLIAGWKQPARALLGTLPLALIPALVWWIPRWGAPGDIALLEGLGRFFADPGIAQSAAGANWWWYLLGWPLTPPSADLAGVSLALAPLALWFAIPLIALALAVFSTRRADIQVALGALVFTGVITAAVAPGIAQGYLGTEPVFVWPGSAVMLIVLGLGAAAAATLDELQPESFAWGSGVVARRVSAGLLAAATVGAALAAIAPLGGGLWSESATLQARSEARTVPALVAAEARSHPQQGTLVITEGVEPGVFEAVVVRGVGDTLERSSSLYRQRPAQADSASVTRASLVAAIVQPTSTDPRQGLLDEQIRFIWFQGNPESDAARTMGQRPYFIQSGTTEDSVLFQVDLDSQETPQELSPTPAQAQADGLWLASWLLWGVLALPTERRPRRRSEEGDDASSLQRVLDEDTDD